MREMYIYFPHQEHQGILLVIKSMFPSYSTCVVHHLDGYTCVSVSNIQHEVREGF